MTPQKRLTPVSSMILACIVGIFIFQMSQLAWAQGALRLIDLTSAAQVRARRPVLIAHRGGVVTEKSPQCSMAALNRAGEAGYAMTELDVQRSRDGVPIVFHDADLLSACGRSGGTSDYTASELLTFAYTGTDQTIISLEVALRRCHELGIGVMLDLKHGGDDGPFLEQIDQLISQFQLTRATVSISGSQEARARLKHVMFTPSDTQMAGYPGPDTAFEDLRRFDLRDRWRQVGQLVVG